MKNIIFSTLFVVFFSLSAFSNANIEIKRNIRISEQRADPPGYDCTTETRVETISNGDGSFTFHIVTTVHCVPQQQ